MHQAPEAMKVSGGCWWCVAFRAAVCPFGFLAREGFTSLLWSWSFCLWPNHCSQRSKVAGRGEPAVPDTAVSPAKLKN